MDSILKTFSIGFLLRSVFAGIFVVVSYYVAFYGLEATVMKIEAKSISSPALLVALFAGVVVYGVHRSMVYPFIEGFFDSKVGKDLRKWRPKALRGWKPLALISHNTIQTLLWRWDQGAEERRWDHEKINKRLNEWADSYTFSLRLRSA
jgi:hypothetical protein